MRPDDQVFGTVGQPIPGTEIRIAPDDEILLRGPHLMTGYHNLPRENADVLLADGWLATGDIGSLDAAGRLRVTDRKKDLVKTSGGKYIAPGVIAARFTAMTALGSHLIVHAKNRSYVTALVSLDPDALAAFATAHQMPGEHVTLSQSVPVRAAILATIDELNATLNQWETIKKFTILTRDLTESRGELTTSLKVKRNVVEQHFTHQLDAMYTYPPGTRPRPRGHADRRVFRSPAIQRIPMIDGVSALVIVGVAVQAYGVGAALMMGTDRAGASPGEVTDVDGAAP